MNYLLFTELPNEDDFLRFIYGQQVEGQGRHGNIISSLRR